MATKFPWCNGVKLSDVFGMEIKPKLAAFVIEYSKDCNARRAAMASGHSPDSGYKLLEKDEVQACLARIFTQRLEASHIDAEWVLMEAVDNHQIARQSGNITASNTALTLIAKHTAVDALASDKLNVNVAGDKQIMERLIRARSRESVQNVLQGGEPTEAGSTEAGSTEAGSTEAGSTDPGSTDPGSTEALTPDNDNNTVDFF